MAGAKGAKAQVERIEGFRAPSVARMVGITYRQLDYWARKGLVTPSIKDADGSGSQRLYGFTDVVHLKLIKKLLDAGVSLQKVSRAVMYIKEDLRKPLEEVTLVSDGKGIYACTSRDEVFDLLAAGQGVFGIAVGKVYEELQGSIAELKIAREPTQGGGSGAKVRGG
jgi:DNA-binding transcriptional MerR regulator